MIRYFRLLYYNILFSLQYIQWQWILAAFFAGVLIAILYKFIMKATIKQCAVLALLITYIGFIMSVTVFGRVSIEKQRYELMPFWSYYRLIIYQENGFLFENINNMLLFMPIGFFLTYLIPNESKKLVLLIVLACMVSISIELLQFVLQRGVLETDDVIHNVIGAALGYLVCIFFSVIKRNNKKDEKDDNI